jgi:hypothetical protein
MGFGASAAVAAFAGGGLAFGLDPPGGAFVEVVVFVLGAALAAAGALDCTGLAGATAGTTTGDEDGASGGSGLGAAVLSTGSGAAGATSAGSTDGPLKRTLPAIAPPMTHPTTAIIMAPFLCRRWCEYRVEVAAVLEASVSSRLAAWATAANSFVPVPGEPGFT